MPAQQPRSTKRAQQLNNDETSNHEEDGLWKRQSINLLRKDVQQNVRTHSFPVTNDF